MYIIIFSEEGELFKAEYALLKDAKRFIDDFKIAYDDPEDDANKIHFFIYGTMMEDLENATFV